MGSTSRSSVRSCRGRSSSTISLPSARSCLPSPMQTIALPTSMSELTAATTTALSSSSRPSASSFFPGVSTCPEKTEAWIVFVADEAFQLRDHILRRFPGKSAGADRQRRLIYNYRLSRARRVVENAFGILVSKWRIFRQPIIAKVETVDAIVKAACVLHNFLRRRDGESSETRHLTEDAAHDRHDGSAVEIGGSGLTDVMRLGSNNAARQAFQMRERFADYFISPEGSVPWQDNVVNRGQLNLGHPVGQ